MSHNNDVKQIQVGENLIRICLDESAESPREWDNLGKMICWHRRYKLGDKHNFANKEDFAEWINKNPSIMLPLYLYDHGGITINTWGFSCPWDSGQVGYIYVTLEDIRKAYKKERVSKQLHLKVEKSLRAEVANYDDYLTGNIYGYIVETKEGEHIDSCWGFYGLDECVRQATEAASV